MTVPVYWAVAVIAVTGVAPVSGAVAPGMAATLITATAVAGKAAVTTPELTAFVGDVTPATVKRLAATPVRVKPVLAVNVMVAV